MCGFGGIINAEQLLEHAEVAKIAGKVRHRGPDSCGIRILDPQLQAADQGQHAVFFNRLAIIDTDHRSDQPFEDEDHLLIFNGEIYNYQDLRRELENRNITFKTTSDTEVLFYCLREWKEKALPRLNGMFAFFWLDKKNRKFLAGRDRLGIKPFYYSNSKRTFIFSSEIDSVVRLSAAPREINRQSVDMFLWMQFVPSPYSIVKGIYKIPPGNYLSGNVDGPENLIPVPFWDAYTFVSETASEKYDEHKLEQILKETLDRQLHADVPLGLFLSSGVDSSLLAALVNKYYSKEHAVNFFTVKFEQETISDESQDARNFIKGFNNPNLTCHTIDINSSTIGSEVMNLYSYYDEPFGDMAAILNWAVSKKAREYVTVAISGDGADELFWGYSRYTRWQKFNSINRTFGAGGARAIFNALPYSKFTDNTRFVLEKDPVKRHFNFFLPSGMRFKIRDHITRYPLWSLQGADAIKQRDDMTALLDIKTYLADAMLYKVDRSSMANSLEVRVPYLDNEVLEYALKLPLTEKSDPAIQHKKPLKQLLHHLAPHYDLARPKKGFNFPLEHWLKNNWQQLVVDTINKNDLEDAGLDSSKYLKLVSDFYASKNNYFTDVWYLFNLCLWIKKFKAIG